MDGIGTWMDGWMDAWMDGWMNEATGGKRPDPTDAPSSYRDTVLTSCPASSMEAWALSKQAPLKEALPKGWAWRRRTLRGGSDGCRGGGGMKEVQRLATLAA